MFQCVLSHLFNNIYYPVSQEELLCLALSDSETYGRIVTWNITVRASTRWRNKGFNQSLTKLTTEGWGAKHCDLFAVRENGSKNN